VLIKKKIGCVYHRTDLDGKCSGAIVRIFEEHAGNTVEFIGLDHADIDEKFDIETLVLFDKLYMVDFSLPPAMMLQLREIYGPVGFIWCDHHISALRNADEHNYADISGVRTSEFAGCELTWRWFNPLGIRTSIPLPTAVHLLGRYDVWDHSADGRIMPFQYGMRQANYGPDCSVWDGILPRPNSGEIGASVPEMFSNILHDGAVIYDYLQEQWKRQTKALAREIVWAGHRFVAANIPLGNSAILEPVYPVPATLFLLYYQHKSGAWKVSMYTKDKDVDLSVIAVTYGGSGHAGACGFNCAELPDELRIALSSPGS